MNDIRTIAIHLPQFHPIPENDEWWGKGFTEWTNVTKAKPFFKKHYQPQLPTDLGYYDLRLPEARQAQVDLAKQYGIYGFAYYHYWFNGKRLLNQPVDEILKTKKPDFPFLLFWANESWSRRWWGEEKEVLIKQTYSEQDDINHASWLCENVFTDERYIKIEGKPVFIIYRPHDLPDSARTVEIFKETALKKGLPEPYMINNSSNLKHFDHRINFEPQFASLAHAMNDGKALGKLKRNIKLGVVSNELKIYDYKEVKEIFALRIPDYNFLPCVFVGYDNTARRGKRGVIIHNQNVQDFKASLYRAKKLVQDYPAEEKIVFINAWNEWAEGNHLEPCIKYGHSFLEAVKEVFDDN